MTIKSQDQVVIILFLTVAFMNIFRRIVLYVNPKFVYEIWVFHTHFLLEYILLCEACFMDDVCLTWNVLSNECYSDCMYKIDWAL